MQGCPLGSKSARSGGEQATGARTVCSPVSCRTYLWMVVMSGEAAQFIVQGSPLRGGPHPAVQLAVQGSPAAGHRQRHHSGPRCRRGRTPRFPHGWPPWMWPATLRTMTSEITGGRPWCSRGDLVGGGLNLHAPHSTRPGLGFAMRAGATFRSHIGSWPYEIPLDTLRSSEKYIPGSIVCVSLGALL